MLRNGNLHNKDKIILCASLIDKVLHLAYGGAHSGQNGHIRILTTHFHITGINKIVEEFVKNCNFVDYLVRKHNTK